MTLNEIKTEKDAHLNQTELAHLKLQTELQIMQVEKLDELIDLLKGQDQQRLEDRRMVANKVQVEKIVKRRLYAQQSSIPGRAARE